MISRNAASLMGAPPVHFTEALHGGTRRNTSASLIQLALIDVRRVRAKKLAMVQAQSAKVLCQKLPQL